ncbi:MAG: class I SAM-dependent methyltransferase [Chloroflexota bacterium]|nr:class I SAM-dependent methyltransferase [Chloroflexota bacterium]MDE2919567.1 class I SAM-dependent methyltransferase [Chloroflexota bacterium]
MDEPTPFEQWLTAQASTVDPFKDVRAASEAHRRQHGAACPVYPTSRAPLWGLLAGAIRSHRILEIGTGLGYSALWLARGAPDAQVTTVEADHGHVTLARENVRKAGYADRIKIVHSCGIDFLRVCDDQLDLIFCDCDIDDYGDYPSHLMRLLRVGGLLITANLFAGWYVPGMPGLDAAISYRHQVLRDERLLTTFLGSNAISLRIR